MRRLRSYIAQPKQPEIPLVKRPTELPPQTPNEVPEQKPNEIPPRKDPPPLTETPPSPNPPELPPEIPPDGEVSHPSHSDAYYLHW